MTSVELDQIVADLTTRMGAYCLRVEIEALARLLGRSPGEVVGRGVLWSSSMEAVMNDLFIPDRERLEPSTVNHIVAQLLRQDVPAWREHIFMRDKRDRDYWSQYD